MVRATFGRHLQKSSMFLVSLAVADLLLLFICAPLETLHYFLMTWDQTLALCKLGSYVKMLSAVSSVLNLTAVSFERYVVIVYPMRSRALCTMSNCRRSLIVVWFVAFLLSAPITVSKGPDPMIYYNNSTCLTIYYCFDTEEEDGIPLLLAFYQFAIMFALPLLLMTYCYARVIKELWMSTKNIASMTVHSAPRFDSRSSISSALRNGTHVTSTSSSTNSFLHRTSPTRLSNNCDDVKQARKQVIKMLILVIALFLVCWGPQLILNILMKFGLRFYTQSMYSLRITFTLLPFVHSCLNPIIYSFMSSNFRRLMMRTCSNQSCGPGTSSFCCPKGRPNPRLRYCSSNYDTNGDSRRGCHVRLQHTCSNTCTSEVRTSPITECESHDAVSFA